jgi:hypothetical protein
VFLKREFRNAKMQVSFCKRFLFGSIALVFGYFLLLATSLFVTFSSHFCSFVTEARVTHKPSQQVAVGQSCE